MYKIPNLFFIVNIMIQHANMSDALVKPNVTIHRERGGYRISISIVTSAPTETIVDTFIDDKELTACQISSVAVQESPASPLPANDDENECEWRHTIYR
jgi:hypothetical protein